MSPKLQRAGPEVSQRTRTALQQRDPSGGAKVGTVAATQQEEKNHKQGYDSVCDDLL